MTFTYKKRQRIEKRILLFIEFQNLDVSKNCCIAAVQFIYNFFPIFVVFKKRNLTWCCHLLSSSRVTQNNGESTWQYDITIVLEQNNAELCNGSDLTYTTTKRKTWSTRRRWLAMQSPADASLLFSFLCWASTMEFMVTGPIWTETNHFHFFVSHFLTNDHFTINNPTCIWLLHPVFSTGQ